jgi:hypothetical protein
MRTFGLLCIALSGCGSILGDNESFDVVVHDASEHGVAGTIITINMAADNPDHVCGKTDTNGRAVITWNACQFTELRCERNPYSVTAAASGYVTSTQLMGFSQDMSASVQLTPCGDGVSCPDPSACTD